MFAKIQDWAEKQHYHKRSPPWIKLHRNILDSRRFQTLPLASKALAPQLWLLASENDGNVNIEIDDLIFRLRWPREEVEAGIKPLIKAGYLIVDSAALAECEQDVSLEGEGEGEEETEEETEGEIPAREKRASAPKAKNGSAVAKLEERTPGSLVWEAYAMAYEKRYKTPPVRNAKVNSQMKQLVKRLGEHDAVAVAGWYPFHRTAIYARSRHCTDLLIRDAEGLRTEWATGTITTEAEAREGDGLANRGAMWSRLMEECDEIQTVDS